MSALSLHDAVRAKLRAMTGGGGQSASREPSSQVESVAESVPSQFDRMKSKIKSASRFRVGVRHIEKSPHMQLPSSDKSTRDSPTPCAAPQKVVTKKNAELKSAWPVALDEKMSALLQRGEETNAKKGDKQEYIRCQKLLGEIESFITDRRRLETSATTNREFDAAEKKLANKYDEKLTKIFENAKKLDVLPILGLYASPNFSLELAKAVATGKSDLLASSTSNKKQRKTKTQTPGAVSYSTAHEACVALFKATLMNMYNDIVRFGMVTKGDEQYVAYGDGLLFPPGEDAGGRPITDLRTLSPKHEYLLAQRMRELDLVYEELLKLFHREGMLPLNHETLRKRNLPGEGIFQLVFKDPSASSSSSSLGNSDESNYVMKNEIEQYCIYWERALTWPPSLHTADKEWWEGVPRSCPWIEIGHNDASNEESIKEIAAKPLVQQVIESKQKEDSAPKTLKEELWTLEWALEREKDNNPFDMLLERFNAWVDDNWDEAVKLYGSTYERGEQSVEFERKQIEMLRVQYQENLVKRKAVDEAIRQRKFALCPALKLAKEETMSSMQKYYEIKRQLSIANANFKHAGKELHDIAVREWGEIVKGWDAKRKKHNAAKDALKKAKTEMDRASKAYEKHKTSKDEPTYKNILEQKSEKVTSLKAQLEEAPDPGPKPRKPATNAQDPATGELMFEKGDEVAAAEKAGTDFEKSEEGRAAYAYRTMNNWLMTPYDASNHKMLAMLQCYPASKEMHYRTMFKEGVDNGVRNNFTAGVSLAKPEPETSYYNDSVLGKWKNSTLHTVVPNDLTVFRFLTEYCDAAQEIPWVEEGPGRPYEVQPKKVTQGEIMHNAPTGAKKGKARGDKEHLPWNAWKIQDTQWIPPDGLMNPSKNANYEPKEQDFPGIDEEMCKLYMEKVHLDKAEGKISTQGSAKSQWLKTGIADRERRGRTAEQEIKAVMQWRQPMQIKATGPISFSSDNTSSHSLTEDRRDQQQADELDRIIKMIIEVGRAVPENAMGIVPGGASRQLLNKISVIVRFSDGCVWNNTGQDNKVEYIKPDKFGIPFHYRNPDDPPGLARPISDNEALDSGLFDEEDDSVALVGAAMPEEPQNNDEGELLRIMSLYQRMNLGNKRNLKLSGPDEGKDSETYGQITYSVRPEKAPLYDAYRNYLTEEEQAEKDALVAAGENIPFPNLVLKPYAAVYNALNKDLTIETMTLKRFYPKVYEAIEKPCQRWWTAYLQGSKEDSGKSETEQNAAYKRRITDEYDIVWGPGDLTQIHNDDMLCIVDENDEAIPMRERPLSGTEADVLAIKTRGVPEKHMAESWSKLVDHASRYYIHEWWERTSEVWSPIVNNMPYAWFPNASAFDQDPGDRGEWKPMNNDFEKRRFSQPDPEEEGLELVQSDSDDESLSDASTDYGDGGVYNESPSEADDSDDDDMIWDPKLHMLVSKRVKRLESNQNIKELNAEGSIVVYLAGTSVLNSDGEVQQSDDILEQTLYPDAPSYAAVLSVDNTLYGFRNTYDGNWIDSDETQLCDFNKKGVQFGPPEQIIMTLTMAQTIRKYDQDNSPVASKNDWTMVELEAHVRKKVSNVAFGYLREEFVTVTPTSVIPPSTYKSITVTIAVPEDETATSVYKSLAYAFAEPVSSRESATPWSTNAINKALGIVLDPQFPPEVKVESTSPSWISEDTALAQMQAAKSNTRPVEVSTSLSPSPTEQMYVQWFNESHPYASALDEDSRSLRAMLSANANQELRIVLGADDLDPEERKVRNAFKEKMYNRISADRMREIGMVCDPDGKPPMLKEGDTERDVYWIQPKHKVNATFWDPNTREERQVTLSECFGLWDPLQANWIYFPDRKVVPIEERHAPIGLGYAIKRSLATTLNVEDAKYERPSEKFRFVYDHTGLTDNVIANVSQNTEEVQSPPLMCDRMSIGAQQGEKRRSEDSEDAAGSTKKSKNEPRNLLTAKAGWGSVVTHTVFDAVYFTPNLRHVRPFNNAYAKDWTTIYFQAMPAEEVDGQFSTDNKYAADAFWNVTNAVWIYRLDKPQRSALRAKEGHHPTPSEFPKSDQPFRPVPPLKSGAIEKYSYGFVNDVYGDTVLLEKLSALFPLSELLGPDGIQFYDYPYPHSGLSKKVWAIKSTSSSADLDAVGAATSLSSTSSKTEVREFGDAGPATLFRRAQALALKNKIGAKRADVARESRMA